MIDYLLEEEKQRAKGFRIDDRATSSRSDGAVDIKSIVSSPGCTRHDLMGGQV